MCALHKWMLTKEQHELQDLHIEFKREFELQFEWNSEDNNQIGTEILNSYFDKVILDGSQHIYPQWC